MEKIIQDCATFINQSSSTFHTIDTIKKELIDEGYVELKEHQSWQLIAGNKYFITRNLSSILAFKIPSKVDKISFNLTASHSDVCSFKIKPNTTIKHHNYVQLNTEGYGGMLCSTWMDRPLSIAGRIMLEEDNKISEQLFDVKEPCLIIPNVAIHMNREANDGFKFNKQVDMMPIVALDQKEFDFKKFLSRKLNIKEESISYYDAYLYNPQPCLIWGENKEFFSGPRLDDQQMAYASLVAFLQSTNDQSINVYCCFDNEEVGSRTRQGAASSFLKETLKRIVYALNQSSEEYYAALARSFMVSCDNAHALHPNHPEKADALNRPEMNKGVVVKFNAAQSYTSDALSASYFAALCKIADVPYQSFTNRSDLVGGGTLGNISTAQVSIPSVDIGIAQLAMHSTFETSGSQDIIYTIEVLKAFYNAAIMLNQEGSYIIK